MKSCSNKKCTQNNPQPKSEFYGDGTKLDGLASICKTCKKQITKRWTSNNKERKSIADREWRLVNKPPKPRKKAEKNSTEWHRDWRHANRGKVKATKAKRRAAKLQRTPFWSDLKIIKQFYINCPEGYEVDHIVPLQGKHVSGLHVPGNLQYLTKAQNSSKNNKYGLE